METIRQFKLAYKIAYEKAIKRKEKNKIKRTPLSPQRRRKKK